MLRRPRKPRLDVGLLLLSVLAPGSFAAQGDDDADEPRFQRCISIRAIRSTDVINDNAILFRTVGGDVFVNELPQTCRGLSRDRRFTYELRERRLCANDRIRILMVAGSSMIEGTSCKLGEFRRLTPEEMTRLFSPDANVPEPEPVDPPDVEELEGDAEERQQK